MSLKPTKKPSGEPEKLKREDRDKPTFNKDASPFLRLNTLNLQILLS